MYSYPNMDLDEEQLERIERLMERVPPDDVYIYLYLAIDSIDSIFDTIYDLDDEFFKMLLMQDPTYLPFAHLIAMQMKTISEPQE